MEFGTGDTGTPRTAGAGAADTVLRQLGAAKNGQTFFQRGLCGSDENLAGAVVTDMTGQHSGVDAFNTGETVFLHDVRQRSGAAEVGGTVVVFAHDERNAGGTLGLAVIFVDAIVADHGVGHNDGLIGIGRIGHDFLIADHRGVEDELADALTGTAEAVAEEFAAVFQNEFSVKSSSHLLLLLPIIQYAPSRTSVCSRGRKKRLSDCFQTAEKPKRYTKKGTETAWPLFMI